MINDQTPITSDILLRNGWREMLSWYQLEDIQVEVEDGFACWICSGMVSIGKPFYTIGELKAIAKALYKIELKLE